MSEQQFIHQADTGDILLFRATSGGGMLTRTFTASHFDHVAMVLKFEAEPDEVYLIEALGNTGVSLNKWAFLRQHVGEGKFYQKLVLRHLHCDRDDKMVDNLEIFLKEAIGLQYGISAGKLSRAKTVAIKEDDANTLIETGRTFFCSELVAKAFKCLGIIEDDDTSCATYYPHHFSSRGDEALKLTKGTSIEPEQQIIVDRKDFNSGAVEYLPKGSD